LARSASADFGSVAVQPIFTGSGIGGELAYAVVANVVGAAVVVLAVGCSNALHAGIGGFVA